MGGGDGVGTQLTRARRPGACLQPYVTEPVTVCNGAYLPPTYLPTYLPTYSYSYSYSYSYPYPYSYPYS